MGFDPISIAIAVVSFALSYASAKKAQKAAKKAADAMKGVLLNKESNIEPIPVIYGERRVGGTRVYVHTEGGKKNKYLYIALVLCEGEVEDIYDIKIDDYDLLGGRYGSVKVDKYNGVTVYNSDPNAQGTDLVYITAMFGQDGQGYNATLRGASNWTNNHQLNGVAYLGIRLRWDQEIFSGMPEITAVVKGKKVRDPRNNNAVAWSDNPALCLLDYLKNNRYGKGLPDTAIDINSFKAAADYCDASSVRTNTGDFSQEKIFRCNYVLDTGDKIFENVQKMLLGCRGFLPYTDGKYKLVIDGPSDPVMTLTTNEIIGGIGITGESKKDRFNRVLIKFPNPKAEWQPDEAYWPDAGSLEETTFQAEDGGELLVDEVDMEMITSYYAARDFAKIFCLRSRNALRVQISCTSEAMDLVPSDVVLVKHPTPGWGTPNSTLAKGKPFQVEEMSLNFDGTVDLQLIEYDPSLYTYDIAAPEESYPDTSLPDPDDIDPPTDLQVVETTVFASDGTLLIAFDVSWTESLSSYVSSYEVAWYKGTGPVIFDSTVFYTSALTSVTSYRINNLEVSDYVIGVRAISTTGVRSEWVYAEFTAEGDVTPPNPPKEPFGVVGGFKQIELYWTNDTVSDLHYTAVFEAITKSDGGDSIYRQIATVPAPANSYIRTGLGFNERRFYLLRAVDYSGNRSEQQRIGSAFTLGTDSGEFRDSIVNIFEEADLGGIPHYVGNENFPSAGQVGDLIYNIEDKKLYEWTGDRWEYLIPDINDLIGELPTTVTIADDFIASPMIKAGSITSEKLYAGTVAADLIQTNNITAGAISASLIAADAIQTKVASIDKAFIDAVHINNGSITNAKIKTAAVDTLSIAGNAVTIPAGASGSNVEINTSNIQGITNYSADLGSVFIGLDDNPDKRVSALIVNYSCSFKGAGLTGGQATTVGLILYQRAYTPLEVLSGFSAVPNSSVGSTSIDDNGISAAGTVKIDIATWMRGYIEIKFQVRSTHIRETLNWGISVLGSKR